MSFFYFSAANLSQALALKRRVTTIAVYLLNAR